MKNRPSQQLAKIALPPPLDLYATGLVVQAIREKKGMNLDQMAQQLKSSPSTISRLERGLRRLKLDEAYMYSQLEGLSTDQLIGRIRQFQNSDEFKQIKVAQKKLASAQADIRSSLGQLKLR